MRTRAAVTYGLNTRFDVKEVELDEPGANEVLVHLVASGVCHSDMHHVTGDQIAALPMIFGHEGAGVVEQVGANVTHVVPGDHVVMSYLPSCGTCRWCTDGQTNLCDLGAYTVQGPQIDGTFRFRDDAGVELGQFCLVSTFSEWTVVPGQSVVKVDKHYRLERACLVACGVTTGVGTAIYRGGVEFGDDVMVFGVGGIGMNIVQGAKIAGAKRIIACDTNDWKLEQAKLFGATHTVNPNVTDPVEFATELTWGVGVDKAFEAIATAETIGQAVRSVRKSGTVAVVGLTRHDQPSIPINPSDFVLWQKTLTGSLNGGCNPRNDIPKMLKLWDSGQINLDGLVTKEYRIEQINDAYDDLLAGKNLRGVIRYEWADNGVPS
ncbi:alcohol dehydrogenase [Mycobacterium sp. MS1601]|uniref:Zn-dependent alcohol dehydrogenase n=1 Tax=Mycobacterium sp. MS1601 TaxID=1936029 RepID=UPI0009794A7D|nr:Zn-dependent alcohol dehydrogenase [Mycobacterium sp. MS1601]AQA02465.1 alcohol dehydrogenase [Mycobacterium sp. MS1601]